MHLRIQLTSQEDATYKGAPCLARTILLITLYRQAAKLKLSDGNPVDIVSHDNRVLDTIR